MESKNGHQESSGRSMVFGSIVYHMIWPLRLPGVQRDDMRFEEKEKGKGEDERR